MAFTIWVRLCESAQSVICRMMIAIVSSSQAQVCAADNHIIDFRRQCVPNWQPFKYLRNTNGHGI